MAPRENRRVLVLLAVAVLLAVLAAVWYHRLGGGASPEERAREKAGQLRERIRDLTHGK